MTKSRPAQTRAPQWAKRRVLTFFLVLSLPIAMACSTHHDQHTPAASLKTSDGAPGAPATKAAAVSTPPTAATKKDVFATHGPHIGPPLPASLLTQLRDQDWPGASSALTTHRAQLNTTAPLPYYDFLAAHLARQTGDHKACVTGAAKAAKATGDFALRQDAWALGAECGFESRQWHEVALHAAQVKPTYFGHERALFLLGQALQNAGTKADTDNAIKVYSRYLKAYPKGSNATLVRYHLGTLLESESKWADAARQYNDMLTYSPLSSEVPQGLARLAKLKPKLTEKVRAELATSDDTQRINKLRALFARHRSDQAVEDGARYIKGFDKGGKLRCEALYLVAKSYSKLRKHTVSLDWYDQLITECPTSEYALKAHYLKGKAYWNSGKRAKAKPSFKKVWTTWKTHSYADDSMLYVSRILSEEGKKSSMRKLLKRQVTTYPKGDMAKDAHWLLVRDLLERKKYSRAVTYIDGIKDPGEHDLYSQGRLRYFKGRALELSGKKKKAAAVFEGVVRDNPLGYYALLALNRLAEQAIGSKKKRALSTMSLCEVSRTKSSKVCDVISVAKKEDAAPIALSEKVLSAESFQRGAALMQLGLFEPAASAFGRLSRKYGSSDASQLWSLAMLLDESGAYPLSHNIARRKISGWKDAYPGDINPGQVQRWKIAYPRPFESQVTSWAKAREIPPQIVWAIMREESGFNPKIESWANARGLLQLMEGTGRSMATADGLSGFTTDTLFEAESNIRLGTAYMKTLSDKFEGHPALIIAGYNAGAGNVNRWLKARGDLALDLWVEDIPFGQTRNYTKRVLTSVWSYGWLYDGGASVNMSFTMPPSN